LTSKCPNVSEKEINALKSVFLKNLCSPGDNDAKAFKKILVMEQELALMKLLLSSLSKRKSLLGLKEIEKDSPSTIIGMTFWKAVLINGQSQPKNLACYLLKKALSLQEALIYKRQEREGFVPIRVLWKRMNRSEFYDHLKGHIWSTFEMPHLKCHIWNATFEMPHLKCHILMPHLGCCIRNSTFVMLHLKF